MLHYNPQHISSSNLLVFRRTNFFIKPLVSSLSVNSRTVYWRFLLNHPVQETPPPLQTAHFAQSRPMLLWHLRVLGYIYKSLPQQNELNRWQQATLSPIRILKSDLILSVDSCPGHSEWSPGQAVTRLCLYHVTHRATCLASHILIRSS